MKFRELEVPGTWELEVLGTWELEVPGTCELRNSLSGVPRYPEHGACQDTTPSYIRHFLRLQYYAFLHTLGSPTTSDELKLVIIVLI